MDMVIRSRESIEMLFKQLLLCSKELEKTVLNEGSEPEQWLEQLDEREDLLKQIANAVEEGAILPIEWRKEYLEPFMKIDERMLLVMRDRKDQVSEKIAQLQRGKVINKQYNGYGTPAYGAFFDKKK